MDGSSWHDNLRIERYDRTLSLAGSTLFSFAHAATVDQEMFE